MNENIKTTVVGIDIGVLETNIALVDLRGAILARDVIKTTDYATVDAFITGLSEHIVTLAESSGGYDTVRSVGVSAPSANFLTGCIENASNLPWKGVIPLSALLRDRLGLAVALGNDAHATATGEHVYGSAHGMQNFVVISLSHGGVGSCIFTNGHPHLGSTGSAGEFGHCCVVEDGRLCTCGRKGCLEEYVSDRGIVRTARELMEESDEPSLMRDLSELTPMTIGACVDKGDAMAQEVYSRMGFFLGLALANYVTITNPEAIILTGELTETSGWFVESMKNSFDEHVFGNVRGKVKLVVSQLDNSERDVLGASVLAWQVKEYSLFL